MGGYRADRSSFHEAGLAGHGVSESIAATNGERELVRPGARLTDDVWVCGIDGGSDGDGRGEVQKDIEQEERTFDPKYDVPPPEQHVLREEEEEGERDEVKKMKFMRGPTIPSKLEWEAHMATHTPFRDWCPHCVRGRAVASPHKVGDRSDRESRVPTVAIDYTFLGSDGDETFPVLVVKEDRAGAITAIPVQCKGTGDQWAVDYIKQFIEFIAYKRIVIRSDQEPAILDIKREIGKRFSGEAVPEESFTKDSASNGMIENAVREIQGMIRTIKDYVEYHIGKKINKRCPILDWLIQHAGNIITCFKLQTDGRTAYQRLKGKKAAATLVPFGEKVLFQPVTHGTKRNKLDPRWEYGIYLGFHLRSMEAWISGPSGVCRARNLRRLPLEHRWDFDLIQKITGTPRDLKGIRGDGEMRDNLGQVHERSTGDMLEAPIPKAKRLKITKQDLEEHGLTQDCPGCKATVHGKYTAAHTKMCRERLERKIAEDPVGAERVERRKVAIDQRLAEEIERQTKEETKERSEDKKACLNQEKEEDENGYGQHQYQGQAQGSSNSNSSSRSTSSSSSRSNSSSKHLELEDISKAAQPTEVDGDEPHTESRREQDSEDEGKGVEDKRKFQEGEAEAAGEPNKRRKVKNESRSEVMELNGMPKLANIMKKPSDESVLDFTVRRSEGEQWDFSDEDVRAEAWSLIKRMSPSIVVGKSLDNKPSEGNNVIDELNKTVKHAEFLCALYKDRMRNGAAAIHVQGGPSSIWKLPCMQEIANDSRMFVVNESRGNSGKKQYVRYLTNKELIGEYLSNRTNEDVVWDECLSLGKNKKMDKPSSAVYYDSVSGLELNEKKVIEARRLEAEYFKKLKVFKRVPRHKAKADSIPIIQTKWVDTDKGATYRSRLVAREFRNYEDPTMFAGTPPLEGLKVMICKMANANGSYGMLHIDVSRAYLHARSTRKVAIEIPPEMRNTDDDSKDNIGLLNVSLYGCRDGAANWEMTYTHYLGKLGYSSGKSNPCAFKHFKGETSGIVHGDDFVFVGPYRELEELRRAMDEKFPIKAKLMGYNKDCVNSLIILNRTIKLDARGVIYTADEKHAAAVINALNVQGCKTVETTGTKSVDAQRDGEQVLDDQEAYWFRGNVARCNYLGFDRPEIQFAVKEVAKAMSKPQAKDKANLKRLAKYLWTYPSSDTVYQWGRDIRNLAAYSDSDWAGDARTRLSTSGGCIVLGDCLIKSWSRTQRNLALSSGEAELYAANRAAQEMIGAKSLMEDLGMTASMTLYMDAKATIGTIYRRGIGKLRHVQVQHLWLQQVVQNKLIGVKKVASDHNVADMMTKFVRSDVMRRHLNALKVYRKRLD